jgi:alcohol dehydrogenase
MAIANSGLGYVHGLAGPMGSLHDIPHGVVCGVLLTEMNKALLEEAPQGSLFLTKMERVAKLWGVDTIEGLIDYLEKLTQLADLPSLSSYGFTKEELTEIGRRELKRNSPVELEKERVVEILHSLL